MLISGVVKVIDQPHSPLVKSGILHPKEVKTMRKLILFLLFVCAVPAEATLLGEQVTFTARLIATNGGNPLNVPDDVVTTTVNNSDAIPFSEVPTAENFIGQQMVLDIDDNALSMSWRTSNAQVGYLADGGPIDVSFHGVIVDLGLSAFTSFSNVTDVNSNMTGFSPSAVSIQNGNLFVDLQNVVAQGNGNSIVSLDFDYLTPTASVPAPGTLLLLALGLLASGLKSRARG